MTDLQRVECIFALYEQHDAPLAVEKKVRKNNCIGGLRPSVDFPLQLATVTDRRLEFGSF